MKKNAKDLLETLVKVGVCEAGQRYLNTINKDLGTCINLAKKYPEYFYEHSGFALQEFRKFINKPIRKELEAKNLYVDHYGPVELQSDPGVFFMGDSDAIVSIKDWSIVKIYLFNEAKIKVNAGPNSFASIEAWNSSKVSVERSENAKIIIYQYDNSEASGNATIHKKEYVRGEIFNGRPMSEPDIFISSN